MEQSRNTLLFASCAKEVVTNAQVNVVMSDKALVKQLQKELARLESELRCPTSYSGLEALVKEKDNQIRKVTATYDFSCVFISPSLYMKKHSNHSELTTHLAFAIYHASCLHCKNMTTSMA